MKKSNKKRLGMLVTILTVFVLVVLVFPVSAEDAKKGKLTFDSQGGSAVEAKEFTCDEKLGPLPTPTRSGYSFQGWVTTNGNKPLAEGDVPECGEYTLKAVWTEDCDANCQKCKEFEVKGVPNFATFYGLSISYDGETKKFTVSINGSNDWFSYSNYKKQNFYVSKIEYVNMNTADLTDAGVRASFKNRDDIQTTFGINKNWRLGVGTGDNVKKSISFTNPLNVATRFNVYLTPDGFSNPQLEAACGDGSTFQVRVTYDYFGDQIESDSLVTTQLVIPDASGTGKIDCSKVTVPDNPANITTFEQAYCRDLKAAEARKDSGTTYKPKTLVYNFKDGENFTSKNISIPTYKCDPYGPLSNHNLPVSAYDESKTEQYYSNKSYMIGTTTLNVNAGSYIYNYSAHLVDGKTYSDGTSSQNGKNKLCVYKLTSDGADLSGKISYDPKDGDKSLSSGNFITTPTKVDITCKVSCTEVVTVEYGEPVASKAGFCFDYKVKVTSRVNCESEAPNPPTVNEKLCTPSPGCDHGQGYVDHAAGPNEDFDACVQKCDGGKYTTKCSVSCYNKVYTSGTNALAQTDYYSFADLMGTPLDYSNDTVARDGSTCDGFYARKKNDSKTIVWVPSNHFGRWYCANNMTSNYAHQGCLKDYKQGGGISAICGCWAQCRWNGCKTGYESGDGKKYINPGVSEIDSCMNNYRYEEAKKTCLRYSKCSETQAEFTISVDYTAKDTNQKVTIHFPYTSNEDQSSKDTIKYNESTDTTTCSSESNKLKTTIIGSNGCYKCGTNTGNNTDATSNRWYQVEWTFPGTWIHNKTGEISFEPKTGSSWDKLEGKFCLPRNAADVNRQWYNSYFLEKFAYDDETRSRYSYFEETITEDPTLCRVTNCKTYANGSFPTGADEKIKWNINATARKFGMFQWNINISCFYAANASFPEYEDGKTCDSTGNCVAEGSRIRSVDLGNLFPAEDGAKLTSPETIGRSSAPFNWSTYASNTKTTNFVSQPAAYTKWVQSKNYKIYEGDEYLDYEVTLTKDLINQLRRNGHDNYTAFEGQVVAGSVYNYQSNLFRGENAILKDSAKYPSESVLGCNNIRNYNSRECENVHGEDE